MDTEAAELRFRFSDSEVARLVFAGDTLTVSFAAAWVERPAAGVGPLTGYARGLVMQAHGVAAAGVALDAVGRLRDGGVRLASSGASLTRLDIPGVWQGPLTLELEFAQGPALRWHATRLVATLQQGWDFQESLAC